MCRRDFCKAKCESGLRCRDFCKAKHESRLCHWDFCKAKCKRDTNTFAEQRAKVLRPAVGAPGAAGLPGGHRAGRGGKRPGSIGGVCRVLVSFFLQLGAPRKRPSARNKEVPFRGRVFCRIRADFARKVCAFHRVAFFAPQSDECVAAEKRAAAAGGRSRRAREAHP